ncbi:DNA cytosine methyltransferase [Rothia nasimurium]|uniref:DNA cytosine methyltransferase n=1 Tax=Rothia nasimurium TaxID=85336 RepID=UPI001F1EB771|nr:DNA cytosine methyltransferase [Rothia nasimurium]
MNIVDLFSGVGGLSYGFVQEGFNIAYANEYDSEIAKSYKLNHPGTHIKVGDIKDLNLEEEFLNLRGKIDIVMGGPPCQGFSQKGKRKTIHDDRNFLFRNFVDVVKYLTPKYFVMENVPNLLTAENGFFKKELEELFEEIGYSINAKVLNASEFGIPQSRRRAIIIGKIGVGKVKFPEPTFEKITVYDAISDLAFLESGQGSESSQYKMSAHTKYQKLLRSENTDLFNHVATRHTNLALERLKMIPSNCTKKVLPEQHRTKSIYSGTWTRLDSKGVAPTITTRFDTPSSGQFTHPILHRAITVREAARLQSFPDSFRFYGSKSSQMKQVGNAVPPILSRHIAKAIIKDSLGDKQ